MINLLFSILFSFNICFHQWIFFTLEGWLLYLQMEQVLVLLPCPVSTVAQKRQNLPWFKRRLFMYLVASVYSTCLVRWGAFTCLQPETSPLNAMKLFKLLRYEGKSVFITRWDGCLVRLWPFQPKEMKFRKSPVICKDVLVLQHINSKEKGIKVTRTNSLLKR